MLLIMLLLSLCGLLFRDFFAQLKSYVVYMLAFVMLSMGISLTKEDFAEVFKRPLRIAYAGLLHFSIMPLLGYALGRLLYAGEEILYGAVLVGTAPSGTASNVITYLSRGDLAYSVSATAFSTLLSPIATPLLTYLLIGHRVEVPLISMFKDLLLITLIPVLSGLTLRYLFPKILQLERFLPYMAVFFIGVIIAVVLSLNVEKLEELSLKVFLIVLLHNLLGFALGYAFGRLAGLDRRLSKTLSIEVGMQNSGLATLLALKYFSPLVALPAALFSLLQNLNGILLSLFYRRVE